MRKNLKSIIKGKTVLVTGGTGSIGQVLVEKVVKFGAKKIIVFSNDENGLYEMESSFSNNSKIQYIIGDIRDPDTVSSLVKGIDIVFHAAALKHVDRCESIPFEAVTVNILGTKNIIKYSISENVKKVIFISTDKAVNPFGVMGATKLLAEKLISAESLVNETIFASVRLGNVLNTRGSIIPRIAKQIEKGGPITLTDKRMKRFFMTKDEAVNLILHATELSQGGETFVMKMPIVKLIDLFEAMKIVLAPKFGYESSKIKTKIIGIKRGEKLTESLLTNYELSNVLETNNFFIIPKHFDLSKKYSYPGVKIPKNPQKFYDQQKPLSTKKLIQLLEKIY